MASSARSASKAELNLLLCWSSAFVLRRLKLSGYSLAGQQGEAGSSFVLTKTIWGAQQPPRAPVLTLQQLRQSQLLGAPYRYADVPHQHHLYACNWGA
jgi:hypothetical protein